MTAAHPRRRTPAEMNVAGACRSPPRAARPTLHSIHLSKHPARDSYSIQMEPTRGGTAKQTPDGMAEQGGEEEKSSAVCGLHKASLRKWAEWPGWEEGETREGEFSLLFQSPAGTLLQSQRCTSLRTPAELLQLPPGQTSGLTDCRDKERVSRMLCFS